MTGENKFTVGVMGGGEDVSRETMQMAHRLGKLIAEEGWVLLWRGSCRRGDGGICKGSEGSRRTDCRDPGGQAQGKRLKIYRYCHCHRDG
ncbi:Predicted Rossmann fold nucleotide-binding protein (Part 1) [Syntrophaceticus schinkii]|uniref:Predicted Rossmann fold nucleotide-binding protein (Part 1) n=1 Tax=Syntrophaceticus schinkii TaxID=499207 RepID=A0A0B7MPW3_9FIRM|nr:Predicted Rossmann fold nucleotide-binding protein (Part 1) [Syntrophaceticus schinkii]